MKITKQYLVKVIKEELECTLEEDEKQGAAMILKALNKEIAERPDLQKDVKAIAEAISLNENSPRSIALDNVTTDPERLGKAGAIFGGGIGAMAGTGTAVAATVATAIASLSSPQIADMIRMLTGRGLMTFGPAGTLAIAGTVAVVIPAIIGAIKGYKKGKSIGVPSS